MSTKSLLLVAGASVLLLGACQSTAEPAPKLPPPNILFCIADDWSWPHASISGEPVIQTPTFDRIARRGVLFTNAYCASPSCTPSRGGILSGQAVHRLADGANLHSTLAKDIAVYPDLLEHAGYAVGFTRKGWAPGRHKKGGRTRNPAGPRFKDFGAFLSTLPEGKPFCFWFGSSDPHRGYKKGSGAASGMKLEDVRVPAFLPDTDVVRSDLADYFFEVQRFDREVGELLAQLEARGQIDNTIVVMTSDNGMPFPRAKANIYDAGTHMPLAIQWPALVKSGGTVDAFVSATDFAPTFLAAAGVAVPSAMTGRSLIGLLTGASAGDERQRIFLERERHAHVRQGNLSYPIRAVRTHRYLYIENLRPDRWPAGDPEHVWSVGAYGDVDNSPSKSEILKDRDSQLFQLAFAKRPPVELYDLRVDPDQLNNVAGSQDLVRVQADLQLRLHAWMQATDDPRVNPADDRFDGFPYYGGRARKRRR